MGEKSSQTIYDRYAEVAESWRTSKEAAKVAAVENGSLARLVVGEAIAAKIEGVIEILADTSLLLHEKLLSANSDNSRRT